MSPTRRTSLWPAARAASSDFITKASPIPPERNAGSTLSGPSSNAGRPPRRIRRHPVGADEQRPDARDIGEMIVRRHALAQAIGGAGEAAGPEGALVELFDRGMVCRNLRGENEREIGHGWP